MAHRPVHPEPSAWVLGLSGFAAIMLIMIGLFHVVVGIAAISEEQFYVVSENYIFQFNVFTWGWIYLILGAIVTVAGFGIFSGATWARVIGVIVAVISGITNFMFLPYFPLLSIVVIAVDVAIIWALTASRGGESMER